MHSSTPAALLLLGITALPCAAQTRVPRTLADVPVYAGATRNSAAEREIAALGSEDDAGAQPGAIGRVVRRDYRVYETTAVIEQIVRFYRDRLGAKMDAGDGAGMDPNGPAPGQATPALFTVTDEEFQVSRGEDGMEFSPARKAAVSRVRAPYEPGRWIREAMFMWGVREPNGDNSDYAIAVEDRGFADDETTAYSPRTTITVSLVTYQSSAAAAEERERGQDEAVAARQAELRRHPPTESELGMAIYPGGQLNVQASAGMSSDEEQYFVYLTPDPVARVVQFYEARTGKRAEGLPEGSYAVVLQGAMPFPKLGVVVQPNTMFPGTAKTVFTIRRASEP